MRKKVLGKKLGRNRKSRKKLFRSLARSVILYGKIKTTKAKAQAVRSELEKLMGLVKKGGLSDRRAALARLGNDNKAVSFLFEKYDSLAQSRSSGFVKLALLSPRRGDAAEMMELSWVELPEKPKAKKGEK